jgi:hypothetical protein
MASLSRRTALFGLGGTLALACGGGLARLRTGYALAPGDAAIGLSVKQLAVVRAVVEALLPLDGDLPAGVTVGVHQRIDEEVWAMPDELRSDVRAAVELIEILPLVWGFGGRFSRLSAGDREAAFSRMSTSSLGPVTQAANALKQMSALYYYAADATWPAIGYDGPWVKTPKPPPSSLAYAALRAGAGGVP